MLPTRLASPEEKMTGVLSSRKRNGEHYISQLSLCVTVHWPTAPQLCGHCQPFHWYLRTRVHVIHFQISKTDWLSPKLGRDTGGNAAVAEATS